MTDNHEQWNRRYPSNQIKTTRYTWWNFFPISLFLQFTKVVNCFYLANMILQCFPSMSTNEPEFVGLILATLILIGMGKELMADIKRYRTDKKSNALPIQLVTGRRGQPKTTNKSHSECFDDISAQF